MVEGLSLIIAVDGKQFSFSDESWVLVFLVCLVCCCFCCFVPQQRRLMGSSTQISSGLRRCGSQEQVPEEGSRRFRRVPGCAGVGSGGRFPKVLEGSGACWCRFRRQVPEGSGVCWCRFRMQLPEGSGKFPRVWFVALQP